jgi:hypothetical protein
VSSVSRRGLSRLAGSWAARVRFGAALRTPEFIPTGDLARCGPATLRREPPPELLAGMGLCQDAVFPVFFPWIAAALGAACTLSGRIA